MSKIDKEGYYFPHFSNARNDRKVKRLRKEMQVEGYGIFMMLLEILRDQPDLRYPLSDIDLLETEIGTSQAKIEAVVNRYDLFIIDSDHFHSPRLIEYLEPYFRVKEQRSQAGIKSGESRRLKALMGTSDERSFNGRSTDVEQVKESKVNESKGGEIKEARKRFVSPTLDEVKEEMKNDIEAERFFDYYKSNGWKVSKNPMVDWRASIRNWKRNKMTFNTKGETPNQAVVARAPKPVLDSNGKLIYD